MTLAQSGHSNLPGHPPAAEAARSRSDRFHDVRRQVRRLGFSVAIVVGGFCAATGVVLDNLWQSTWNQAVSSETSLLNVLSQDIARNVEIYDLSLQAVVAGLSEPGLSNLSPRFQDLVLFDRAATARDLGAVLVLDRDGKVVRGLTPDAVGADLSDREYFQAQKANPDRGLFISAPFVRRVTGHDEVIALSRAVKSADGAFDGVVVGTMRLDYFRKLFAQADLGLQGSVHLLRQDGISVVRVPSSAGQVGRNHAGTANYERIWRASSGSFLGTSSVDGLERLYSFTHIGGLPLTLDVARAKSEVFATWYVKATTIIAALAILSATAAVLAFRLRQQLYQTVRTEEALVQSEAQYRMFADHAQDVLVRLDHSLCRTYVSPAITGILGYAPRDLLGQGLSQIVHPDDWPGVAALICTSQIERRNTEATYRLRHKDGHYVWVEGRFSLVTDDGGFIVVLRDISKRKATEEQLETLNAELARAARSDALTGLSNRRHLDEVLASEWRRAARDKIPLSVLLLDVDRFKAYNDRYGHQKGDACLRAVATAVQGAVRRPGDLAARYGGEELAVVLPSTDEAGAAQVAERIRAAVQQLAWLHEGNQGCGSVVTISLGCATSRPVAESDEHATLVAIADVQLYEAKRLGRNRVGTGLAASPVASPTHEEAQRLDVLASYDDVTISGKSDSLDQIARLAAQVFKVPMAFVSLVGQDEAVIVGRHNVQLERALRDDAYCAHTILGDEPLVVPSTRDDPRFSDNVLTRSGIGFYAGAPLSDPHSGHKLGALCLIDHCARPTLDDGQRRLLAGLAGLVMNELTRHRTTPGNHQSSKHRVDAA